MNSMINAIVSDHNNNKENTVSAKNPTRKAIRAAKFNDNKENNMNETKVEVKKLSMRERMAAKIASTKAYVTENPMANILFRICMEMIGMAIIAAIGFALAFLAGASMLISALVALLWTVVYYVVRRWANRETLEAISIRMNRKNER